MALTDLNKEYSEFSSDFWKEIDRDLDKAVQESFERDRLGVHFVEQLAPTPEAEFEAFERLLVDTPPEAPSETQPIVCASITVESEPDCRSLELLVAVESLEDVADDLPPCAFTQKLLSNSEARVQAAKDRRAQREAAKLQKRRKQTAERNRQLRARRKAAPPVVNPHRWTRSAQRRLEILISACACSNDTFLRQLRGREEIHVEYIETARVLRRFATDATVASHLQHHPDITKRSIQNLRRNVAKLEQPGMPWHGLP